MGSTDVNQKTRRAIAIETLEGLFGVEYVQANRDRLLGELAARTGDAGILEVNATESIFEQFEDIFGRGA